MDSSAKTSFYEFLRMFGWCFSYSDLSFGVLDFFWIERSAMNTISGSCKNVTRDLSSIYIYILFIATRGLNSALSFQPLASTNSIHCELSILLVHHYITSKR